MQNKEEFKDVKGLTTNKRQPLLFMALSFVSYVLTSLGIAVAPSGAFRAINHNLSSVIIAQIAPRQLDPRIDPHEPDYLSELDVHKWELKKMPLKVLITPAGVTSPMGERGFDQKLSALIFKAMSQWICSDSSLRIVQTNDYYKADIVIERAAYNELPNNLGGRTVYDYEQTTSVQNQVICRARTYLYTPIENGTDGDELETCKLYTLAMHEAGHEFGLDGHSSNPDDILFVKTINAAPSRHDLATIVHVYPK